MSKTNAELITENARLRKRVALLERASRRRIAGSEQSQRLRIELAEALEQQTATSEILRGIRRTQTDVQPVFDVIASSALRLCDGVASFVFRHDGTLIHLVAFDSVEGVDLQPLRHTFPAPPERVTFAGRVVATARLLYIADIEHDRDAPPTLVEFARANGFRSIFATPMLCDGHTIGLIAVTHRDVDGFTPNQGALLETFADQAVIAIENVRLFKDLEARNRELTETLEREHATGEVLRVISRSPTDIQPVLDVIVENAARLCNEQYVEVLLVDGEVLRLAASHGQLPTAALTRPIRPTLVTGRAVSERRTVHVEDLEAARDEFPDVPRRPGMTIRTNLCVPLLRDGLAIGVFQIRRTEVRPFTDMQIRLIQTFADQAVIAIENVRLFTELQEKNRALTTAHAQVTEALEQQTATAAVLRVIGSSPTDAQPVFEAIVSSARRLLGGFSGGVYRLVGDEIHLTAHTSTTPAGDAALRSIYPRPLAGFSFAGEAIRERVPVVSSDIETDSRVQNDMRRRIRERGFRSGVWVPMLREGAAIGVIGVTRSEPGAFADEQIALLQTFADQAVIAIENVRLFKELEARNAELTDTLARQTATGEV